MFEYLKGIHKVMLKKLGPKATTKLYKQQDKAMAKVLTMDPVTVSAKEYVGERSIFVLTAFNSEYLASLAYIFTCFLPRWRTKSSKLQNNVT